MKRAELAALLQNLENSGVEFKRDDIPPEKLAREMAALLNLEGVYFARGRGRRHGQWSNARAETMRGVGDGSRVHPSPASHYPVLGGG